MGMDGIDLQHRLEKRFEITINSEEAIYLYLTPARVEWLVIEKLARRNPAVVAFQAISERIVDAVSSTSGRRRVWWSFERAFPADRRCELWTQFGSTLGVVLPQLELAETSYPRIPRYVATATRLAIWLLDRHPELCPLERDGEPLTRLGTGSWQDQKVSAAVIEELCDCLGVDKLEITPDSLLTDDLGME